MLNSIRNALLADEPCEQLMDEEENSTEIPVSYLGNVEGYSDGCVHGWAHTPLDPTKRLQVFAYKDNRIVAQGVANIVRDDLNSAGIGDGQYGYQIKIDEALLDGLSHNLKVVCDDDLYELGDIEIQTQFLAEAQIESISAGQLRGLITISESQGSTSLALEDFEVNVYADGEIGATGECLSTEIAGTYTFSITLPEVLFDNQYHSFYVRLDGLTISSNIYQSKLNSHQTDWQFLSVAETPNELSSVSNHSSYRYKALQQHVRNSDPEIVKNAMVAHDVLVAGSELRNQFPILTLPKVSNPLVSVVIPVHNNFAYTYDCIASLILAYNQSSFEVIVVDDKSADQTTHLEDFVENVVIHRNADNLGFQMTSTAGVEAAVGEYVVLLNNDTEVTVGWLDALVALFEKFSNVGLAGSKLIYPNGKLQEAGGIVWSDGKPANVGHGLNPDDPQFCYAREVDYVSGAALMIKADVWNTVGGFSEEFAPAYYEDVDLAFKVRQSGYRTYYCPESVVVHHEGMSHGVDTDSGIKKFQNVNAPKFRSKWRHAFRYNGEHGEKLNVKKDKNIDFRVLMIDHTTPRPDKDAGSYAFIQEMRLLQELGCKITFAPNNAAYMGKYTRALQNAGVECIYAPFYNNVGLLLQARGEEFDLVYITRYDVADELLQYVKQYTKAKVVLNNCDLHFLREMRAALLSENRDLTDVLETRERELDVMENVDAVLSYSDIEHTVIASHSFNEEKIFKCPWVLKPRYSTTPFQERQGIAFLGGFSHLPNVEAVDYFVSQVMPLLREQLDGVEFHIYGSNVTAQVEDLACEDVIVKGFVESLSTVFDASKMLVAPLISGAGLKGKVLDSLAYGVPCVLSPVAVESTGLTHGFNTLVADTPEQWVKCIVDLYNNQATWESLTRNSQSLVEGEYSAENGIEKMSKLMRYLELDPDSSRQSHFTD